MALTESQKVALRRIMTNAPGSPNRAFVSQALQDGMSERAVMNLLKKGMPSKPSSSMLGASRQDKARAAAQKDAMMAQAKPLASKPKPKAKTTAATKDVPFSGNARVSEYTKKQNEALLAKARAKRDAEKATAKKRSADPLGLASPKTKTKAAPTSNAAKKKTKAPAKKTETKTKNYNVGVSKGGVSFNEAFAHFRKKGAKTFTWNGKKYHTKTKSEMKKG